MKSNLSQRRTAWLIADVSRQKMKLNILVVALSAALSGCASSTTKTGSAGHVILQNPRNVRTLTLATGELRTSSGDWTPTEVQIVKVENAIERLFLHPDKRMRGCSRHRESPRVAPFPLSDYYIRYFGVIRNGKQVIVGEAAHRLGITREEALKSVNGPDEAIRLLLGGGGPYYFTTAYDAGAHHLEYVHYAAPL